MEHKKSGLGPVLLVLAISGAEMGWIYAVFRWLSLHGRLASHVRPEQSLGPLIFQDFWATLSWVAIIGAFLWIHRGTAREKLALTLPEGKKRWIVWISAGIYALALAAALFVGKPPALTGYLWLFYLIAVAGGEEVLARGIFPSLLKDRVPQWVQWVLPNVMFALHHAPMELAVGQMDGRGFVGFLLTRMLGLTAVGMLFELYKRKSGSLLPPIFLHALMDFSGVFRM